MCSGAGGCRNWHRQIGGCIVGVAAQAADLASVACRMRFPTVGCKDRSLDSPFSVNKPNGREGPLVTTQSNGHKETPRPAQRVPDPKTHHSVNRAGQGSVCRAVH